MSDQGNSEPEASDYKDEDEVQPKTTDRQGGYESGCNVPIEETKTQVKRQGGKCWSHGQATL